MSTPLSPEEIRAAAETHSELGPAYRDAVIESFLDRVSRDIDARVDARLAQRVAQPTPPPGPSARQRRSGGSPMSLAIISMVLGIPLSAIVLSVGSHPAGLAGLLVVWIAIAVINIAYNGIHG